MLLHKAPLVTDTGRLVSSEWQRGGSVMRSDSCFARRFVGCEGRYCAGGDGWLAVPAHGAHWLPVKSSTTAAGRALLVVRRNIISSSSMYM